MSLNRTYKTFEMGWVWDNFGVIDPQYYYAYTGTVPSWFSTSPWAPSSTEHFPTFAYLPPKGTTGTFTFGIEKYTSAAHPSGAGNLVDSGTVTIEIKALTNPNWNIDHCNTLNIYWLDPSGGFESYLFDVVSTVFQDKGDVSKHVNANNETRIHRMDGVYQGVMIKTSKANSTHSDFMADLFKSPQAYILSRLGSVPIIINPQTFKKVPSNRPFETYEFEFRYAKEDLIQTQ